MKKFVVLVFTIAIFFSSTLLVKAVCDTSELNKLKSLALNVKASYELAKRDVTKDPGYAYPDGLTDEEQEQYQDFVSYFKIHINNLTEDMYVEVTNNKSDEKKVYTYNDTIDGNITFDQTDIVRLRKYTITIYSSGNTGCEGTKLYTTYVTTPMFNSFSEEPMCNGAEDFYLCREWLSTTYNVDNVSERIEKYKKGLLNKDGEETPPEEEKKGFIEFVKEHKGIVAITAIGVIAIGGLVTVIIVKKQRSNNL